MIKTLGIFLYKYVTEEEIPEFVVDIGWTQALVMEKHLRYRILAEILIGEAGGKHLLLPCL